MPSVADEFQIDGSSSKIFDVKFFYVFLLAHWIALSALETASVGSNPGGFFWAFFFFFLLTSVSLTCMGIILGHKVTHSGRDKERKKSILTAPSV